MNRIAILIIIGVLGLTGIIFYGYKKISKNEVAGQDIHYEIVTQWELPDELEEVSGIDWMGANKIACIQDEDGIVFIFNLETSTVEKKIDFAGPGDYEDLRIVGDAIYVLRSDGEIFEVENFLSENPRTKTYSNFLTAKQNLEGLAYDKANNRLLLAIKDREPKDKTYKGIYQFSLKSRDLNKEPSFRLEMQDSLLKRDVKLNRKLEPSALGIHPQTGKFYILDGRSPQLIIADENMNLEKLYNLREADFAQAEGLTFAEDGRLFISNEGKTGKPNILEVKLH